MVLCEMYMSVVRTYMMSGHQKQLELSKVFRSLTTRCLVVHVLLGGRELALVPVEEAHTPAVAGYGSDIVISY